MPPKLQDKNGNGVTPSISEFSAIAPRRSSRKLKQTGPYIEYAEGDDSDMSGKTSPEQRVVNNKRVNSRVRQGKTEKKENHEVVDVAVEELRQMEDNLLDAVKQQKLAIESSALADGRMLSEEAAALLPLTRKSTEVLAPGKNARKRKRDKPSITNGAADKTVKIEEGRNGLDHSIAMDDQTLEEADVADNDTSLKLAAARPPPVNSSYLPLPWKGRLGYACLNTYLRVANPPVFCSRTCRISSILDHRHPLQDPSLPEHATKNRPDKEKPADIALGQRYVESLCLANVNDIAKMLRWNNKYGIKFMRLSSEMFPFASHGQYGYKLAPFASEALAKAGQVAAELGHRLTTHPGQYTQLGSPRKEVVSNAVRDLEYHDEMLSLLRLPDQQNRDAVMILHMGGTFGDKSATLDRFRANYATLSPSVKMRLVLENDDVCWSVHDLLPICEELNIPLVLDFHHHNIYFDDSQIREGTKDIMELFPRIAAMWRRKGIRQKMHYSEPCPDAITPRQRRKHSPRVMTLPPCPDDMDLMIEAKNKEQAVLSLMRNFRLPGWDTFNDIIPYEREDANRPAPKVAKKKPKINGAKKGGRKKAADGMNEEVDQEADEAPPPPPEIPPEDINMGGSQNRVFWPETMEDWLKPKKRESIKNKGKGGDDAGVVADEEND